MNLPLRGMHVPVVTPLAPSNRLEPSLDPAGLERLLEHVIGGGVDGIFLLGTTAEFPLLGRELRQEIIRRTCTLVNHRVPVLINIGDTAISETMHLAETAIEAGADALVLAHSLLLPTLPGRSAVLPRTGHEKAPAAGVPL